MARRLSRREVLRYALAGSGAALLGGAAGRWGAARGGDRPARRFPLGAPDANGLRLPPGFRSRIVARSGQPPIAGGRYRWHELPDGGAVFPSGDGGWVYVSNSEALDGRGGVGALRFDRDGHRVDAYPICRGTTRNCAGGATPWGTWLSCEEVPAGRVWECDPLGRRPAVVRPALGTFMHEAVAVDPRSGILYLTEDTPDGRWYRFTPAGAPPPGAASLDAGTLEVAQVIGGATGRVRWHRVADPTGARVRTAQQVPASTAFDGGEGICWRDGTVYFTTKGDDRVWAYATATETLRIVYDDDTSPTPELTGVDNIAVTPAGDLLVAEDGGNMQLVALAADGGVEPLLEVIGEPAGELAGPAFDPSGTRLYFSSQRGGRTYEVRGPFAG